MPDKATVEDSIPVGAADHLYHIDLGPTRLGSYPYRFPTLRAISQVSIPFLVKVYPTIDIAGKKQCSNELSSMTGGAHSQKYRHAYGKIKWIL